MVNVIRSSKSSDTDVIRMPWWIVVTLGVVFFLWLLTESSGHNWGGDFSQYIHHAVNLVEGRPYAETGYVHNSLTFAGPAVYPPVFPVTLAPVYLLFGLDWIALKAIVIAAFCLAMYFLISLQGNKLGEVYQFAIVIILALNPYYWWLKDQVLSDFYFLLICVLMLSVLNKRYIKKTVGYLDIKRNSWGFAIPLGLLFYLSFATREIGVVFIPTVLCFELFHFRKISVVTCVALVIFLLLVGFQSTILKAPEADVETNQLIIELAREQGLPETPASNIDYFNPRLRSIVNQVVAYLGEMRAIWPDKTENTFIQMAGWIAFMLALLFAFSGYIRAVFSGPGILEIFVAGYLAVLVLFSGNQGLRYLVPVIPIFFFYAFAFHQQLLRSKYRKTMIVIAVLFIGATSITYASKYHIYPSRQIQGITSPDATAFMDYVKYSTPEESIFVFQKPRVLSLLTNRSASAWPFIRDPHFLYRYMSAIGADYVVLSNIGSDQNSYPVKPVSLPGDKFSLEYSNESFHVYKLNTI